MGELGKGFNSFLVKYSGANKSSRVIFSGAKGVYSEAFSLVSEGKNGKESVPTPAEKEIFARHGKPFLLNQFA